MNGYFFIGISSEILSAGALPMTEHEVDVMEVLERNKALTKPLEIRDDKVLLVLKWLLEFKFSSRDILSQLLEQNVRATWPFFKSLEDAKMLKRASNVFAKRETYFMLTANSVSYLKAMDFDVSRAETRTSRFGKWSTIRHDEAVQRFVLDNRADYQSVHWDRNLHGDVFEHQRPDAILETKASAKRIAVEYELWRKSKDRIYWSFYQHAMNIAQNHYVGVFYVFDKRSDLDFYRKLFDEPWIMYRRASKKGLVAIANGVNESGNKMYRRYDARKELGDAIGKRFKFLLFKSK